MRFNRYLNELSSNYGAGITFIDIDETLFNTHAKIYVIHKKTNKIVKKLTNKEYNTFQLPDDEHDFDFREFRDSKLFYTTSKPIPATINRVIKMFKNLDKRFSKVVLLTARDDFDNNVIFKQTFKEVGIPINKIDIILCGSYIKDSGLKISEIKKQVIKQYINTGKFRRVRLIDDDMKNLNQFLELEREISSNTLDKIKNFHKIPDNENFPVIQFFALQVLDNGSLKKIW